MAPSPHHAATRPERRSCGTRVPDAAMPSPTPVKMSPPASPRRAAGTCGSTVGGARTIRVPPARPARKRQRKNQRKDSGVAQPKKAPVASSIMPRSTRAAGRRAARWRAATAPTR